MQAPPDEANWLLLTADELPVGEVYDWAVRSDCGAVVLFSGTVRDHAEGRSGVVLLTYEAYEEQVVPRFADIAAELRDRWPDVGKVAILHRVGDLDVEDCSVVVAVSAPHRGDAFEAARFAIDTLKVSVPIWKRETWARGSDWGTGSSSIVDVSPAPLSAEQRS